MELVIKVSNAHADLINPDVIKRIERTASAILTDVRREVIARNIVPQTARLRSATFTPARSDENRGTVRVGKDGIGNVHTI